MRTAVAREIMYCAEQDESVFLISGDAGFGVWEEYRERFPDRYLNLGIAEQNMIGFAAGMALTGYRVFVYNIAPFVMYRCYEQVRNDICYQRLPVTLIGTGSGITYAPGGMTHYSVEDVALARTLPNLEILSPADPVEARCCLRYAWQSAKPGYLRIAKRGEQIIHTDNELDITRPILIREGEAVAVIFHGSIAAEVIQALDGCACKPKIISLPMLQPVAWHKLGEMLKGVEMVLSVEEHFVTGALGSMLSDWIVREGLPLRLRKLGLPDKYIHDVYKTSGLRRKYHLAAPDIRQAVEEAYVHA